MRCVECGAETADAAQFCVRCGAPVAGPPSVITDAADGAVSDAASGAAPTAKVARAAARVLPEPYVPGRGDKIPAPIRRVRRGYSWMACGAVFGGWASVAAGGYFFNLNSSYPAWWLSAALPLWVLAAVLLGHRIRLSRFLRRPSDGCGAMVAACGRGGRMLMLDTPWDGSPSRLKVRLAWWAEPEQLPPGENVTFYGRPGGVGRVLVSSSAQGRAFVGTGRRPASQVGEETVQDAPPQPGGQRAGRRYLRWAPPAIAGAGFVAAVAATLISAVPSLTGHLANWQLRPGDCLTGSNLGLGTGDTWPYMVAAVPCTDWHLAEVFFSRKSWPRSLAYPGDNAISDQGHARCLTEFKAYDGTDNSASAFMIYFVIPSGGDDWASGDRQLVCVAYLSGAPVDYSIKGTGR